MRVRLLVLALPLALLAGCGGGGHADLQRALDRLVQTHDAPGVSAYVSGPHTTWAGAAGVADVARNIPMSTGARMRIESNSKTWLTALVLQLAAQKKLGVDDTVDQWLPGLLRGHGKQITLRTLMHDTSGLIDDNDVYHWTQAQKAAALARVGDPALRAQLRTAAAELQDNPAAKAPALAMIGLAAWQPLVAIPGTTYHHSNIGWNVLGLVAAKAGGKPLATLYRERLFQPLALHDTAFSPQGPIPGRHAHGYTRRRSGRLVDTTAIHPWKFADGAIVTDAKDEATFLRAAMNGTLFDKALWTDLYGEPSGTGCAARYAGEGAGNGYRSYVFYNTSGSRIAVVLLNADLTPHAEAAAATLYCAA